MSNLTVDTLTNQDIQLCKAWVNFDGTGTVAIRASYNVSSITDNGKGDYTVNFLTAMPDINYSALSTPKANVGKLSAVYSAIEFTNTPRTVSAFRFYVTYATGGAAGDIDSDTLNVAIFR